MQRMSRLWSLAAGIILIASVVGAEDGSAGWLRYERLHDATRQRTLSGPIASLGDSIVIASARNELTRGLSSLVGGEFATTADASKASIVVGTADAIRRRFPRVAVPALTNDGAFWLGTT